MKLLIISPFPPLRGGIAKETNVVYNHLKDNNEVKIINFKRLYPSILFPGKTQFNKKKKLSEDKNILNILDSINPFSWNKVVNYIFRNNYNKIIFRYWHPFFIPCYYYLVKRLKANKKNIKIYFICDNIYPHEKFMFTSFLTKHLFKNVDYFFAIKTH